MEIELGTLQGKPYIFLRNCKVSKEIQDELCLEGEYGEGTLDSSLMQKEIAIPLQIALEGCLIIKDEIASLQ